MTLMLLEPQEASIYAVYVICGKALPENKKSQKK